MIPKVRIVYADEVLKNLKIRMTEYEQDFHIQRYRSAPVFYDKTEVFPSRNFMKTARFTNG